jgi:hypothetical protein
MKSLRRAQAGAMAGLLAGIAVAVLFLIRGAIHLQPFSVPVDLASGLLGNPGTGGPLGPAGAFAVLSLEVLAYTVIHLLTFVAIGLAAAFVLQENSIWTSLVGGAVYGTVVCTGLLYATRWLAGVPVALNVLGLGPVLLANALAGAIIGAILFLAREDGARAPSAGDGS